MLPEGWEKSWLAMDNIFRDMFFSSSMKNPRELIQGPNILESWKQHPQKQQLYGHLPGHCWRSKDKFISDFFLWTHLC